MAEARSKVYIIIEIDHKVEKSNKDKPNDYIDPCTIRAVNNSLEKCQVQLLEFAGEYKKVSGTEKCKYDTLMRSPTVVEIREFDTYYMYPIKNTVKTIILCTYEYPSASK